jgi:hypothetical protein
LPAHLALEILFHVGNAITLIAFLFRDQIQLRAVMVVSMVLQALYYTWLPGGPWFDPLLWKMLTIALNLVMIVVIFRDRFGFVIEPELRPLYEAFHVLNPGQFGRLIKIAVRLDGPRPIIRRGEHPQHLYYLVSGTANITKDGRHLTVGAGVFLGEIAFLSGSGATADVGLAPGSQALAWPVDSLRALMARDGDIEIGLRGVLSHDLAAKTARSHLPAPQAAASAVPLEDDAAISIEEAAAIPPVEVAAGG